MGHAIERFLPTALRKIKIASVTLWFFNWLSIQWANIVEIFYNPVNVLVKASILLQYSRIFNPTGRNNLPIFIAIHVSLWIIILFYLPVMFFVIFECNPRECIWNKLATTGHCYNIIAILKATGVFNVISDFGILLLPMSSIWKLQMTLKRRLLISAVFAIGFLWVDPSTTISFWIPAQACIFFRIETSSEAANLPGCTELASCPSSVPTIVGN